MMKKKHFFLHLNDFLRMQIFFTIEKKAFF